MTGKQGRLAAYWERQQERFDEMERKRARKLPAWRTRRHRRTLSVLVLLGNLVLIAGAAFFRPQPDLAFILVWFGGALLTSVCHTLLRVLTGKMSGGFSLRLDEREREWRHRVTYVSYQVLVALMMFSVFYGLFISGTEDGGTRAAMMGCALLVTGTTLSPVILGWTLPDDDPEDFEEEVNPA